MLAHRALGRGGSPRSIARTMSRCCSATTASHDRRLDHAACSGGCSTAPIHSVNARASRLPAIVAIEPCSRVSRPRSASSLRDVARPRRGSRAAARRRLGRRAARPARRAGSRAASASRSARRGRYRARASMLATESVTLRPIPCSGVAATKMPPPGPLVARIRLPLESSRSASRSVGRLTPKRCARSSSRPSRSPGRSPSARIDARIARRPPRWRCAAARARGGHAHRRRRGRAQVSTRRALPL